jgi:hypothetical protein
VLAVISLITVRYSVSEYVTGLIGVAFIVAAVITSVRARNDRDPELTSARFD